MSEAFDNIFDFTLPALPYPGLRPFEKDEWPIFFGREQMAEEVIDRLIEQQLLVVHGDSGCGKSSLVRAGVLPRLEQEGARGGALWRTAVAAPGDAPLRLLAEGLAALCRDDAGAPRSTEIRRLLNYGTDAPGAVARLLRRDDTDHICVLIDQFEELFTFSRRHGPQEAYLYIQFLMGVLEQCPPGLYVVVTMRSEFLGACAQFRGFAEAVNQVQYLLPHMAHADLVRAIREPASLYGGEVAQVLSSNLIADAGGQQDQLPLIQHGLMLLHRDCVEQMAADTAPEPGWRLDLGDYRSQRGLSGLLSAHADEILRQIQQNSKIPGDPEQQIATVFRALTDIDPDGNAVRRRQTLGQLAAITGMEAAALDTRILQAFRRDGVSFLKPYGTEPLDPEDLVDISHEALIRGWRRLADRQSGWLAEEFRDGLIWQSLRVQAEAFARDENNVLSPTTTAERSTWIKQRNAFWAERYGGRWNEVNGLIEASAVAALQAKRREEELLLAEERSKHQEIERKSAGRLMAETKLKQRRTLIGLVIAILLTVLASALGYRAEIAKTEALRATTQAERERHLAEAERQEADTARLEAEQRSKKLEAANLELQAEIKRREAIQIQAAQTVAKTTSLEDILREIDQSKDAYSLAILVHSLAKQTKDLEPDQAERVWESLLGAARNTTDEGGIYAIAQALGAVRGILPAKLAKQATGELLELVVVGADKHPFTALPDNLAPLSESMTTEEAHETFFKLGAMVDGKPDQDTDAKLQPLFDLLAAQAEFPAPRVYIHISDNKQRAEAERLKTRLEAHQLLGGKLTVPGIQLMENYKGRSAIRCFRREECRVDASTITEVLNNLLKRPFVALEDLSSRYQHADDIRPRHYELWIAPGDIILKRTENTASANRELQLPRPIGPGDKSTDVARVQEWLNIHGHEVTIDGGFGKSTKNAVTIFQKKNRLRPTGKVDQKTFDALIQPMKRALAPIQPKGRSLDEMVVAYAKQHFAQGPIEVGGENSGPWVRLYCDGRDGHAWVWQSCFVSFILNQAADTLRISPPLKGSPSVDNLAAQAKSAAIFIDNAAMTAGRYQLTPGDIFLRRRTSDDWVHAGIVVGVVAGSSRTREVIFNSIEGNTNDAGARNGFEVAARKRSNTRGNYDFICIRGPETRNPCPADAPVRARAME